MRPLNIAKGRQRVRVFIRAALPRTLRITGVHLHSLASSPRAAEAAYPAISTARRSSGWLESYK